MFYHRGFPPDASVSIYAAIINIFQPVKRERELEYVESTWQLSLFPMLVGLISLVEETFKRNTVQRSSKKKKTTTKREAK